MRSRSALGSHVLKKKYAGHADARTAEISAAARWPSAINKMISPARIADTIIPFAALPAAVFRTPATWTAGPGAVSPVPGRDARASPEAAMFLGVIPPAGFPQNSLSCAH